MEARRCALGSVQQVRLVVVELSARGVSVGKGAGEVGHGGGDRQHGQGRDGQAVQCAAEERDGGGAEAAEERDGAEDEEG